MITFVAKLMLFYVWYKNKNILVCASVNEVGPEQFPKILFWHLA